jgi:hypothetical protein
VRPLVPYAEKSKETGPKLAPVEALKTWLSQQGDGVLRLPITLNRSAMPRMFERSAKLGELSVEVDDAALGVSLSEHAHRACPDANVCTVWLEGRWKSGTVQVLHFSRAVAAGEVADFVEREK